MWTVGDACWFKMASIASAECENAHTALAETKAERGRCISSLSLSIYTRILSHPIPFILVCSQALMDAYLHTSPSSPFQGYSPGREDEEEPRRGSGGERGCAHLCAFQQSLSAFDLKKKMWHQRSFLCRGAPLAGHCGGRVTQQLWAGPGERAPELEERTAISAGVPVRVDTTGSSSEESNAVYNRSTNRDDIPGVSSSAS